MLLHLFLCNFIRVETLFYKNLEEMASNKRREEQLKAFDKLLTIMDELREKCPWDKKQTIESLRYLTIEETYELSDAIIEKKSNKTLLHKIKFYPVLYHKPDIFHLQWAKSLEDWIWLQEFGVKVILSLRGTHITISPIANETLASKYKQLFPKVDAFHAVSNSICRRRQR